MNPTAGHLFENAVIAYRAGKREDASDLLWEVLRRDPSHADAWALRARCESDNQRYPNAMLHHGFALQAAPDRYDLWCNRGIDAAAARMFKEACDSFERSLSLHETFEGHYNFGNTLCSTGDVEAAVKHYQRAQELDPDHYQLRANLGVALIGLGRWSEGFGLYRHRFNAPGFPPRPNFQYPVWHGEPLEGKTILLYAEQGFGDEIQSYRFCKLVKEMGARVILSARVPLFRLARDLDYIDAAIVQYDPPPWQPDYMCALLDVPGWCGLTPETVPLSEGYIKVRDQGFDLKFDKPLKVGICWASGKRDYQPSETAKLKSLRFATVARLSRGDVTLVNLQQNHNDAQDMQTLGILDPMAGVADFYDTAWIINQLDLVVTVDTSVAHLAGALGKPVWNLVRFDALWPWMREGGKTCWYDSMTIYRQVQPFDWGPPLRKLYLDYNKFCEDFGKKHDLTVRCGHPGHPPVRLDAGVQLAV